VLLVTAGSGSVGDVRAVPAPFPVQVGGSSAELVDTKASLFGRMPLALGLIALVTFTLLVLLTGSVVLPVKALTLNLLSLTATFGAMVWVFQLGHLSSLLGFTPTGTIDTTMPMLMFCVTFGLSMDYEVFLLSRIKEEHDRGTPAVQAVALGLERVGRIVTTAAALLAIVFVAFATSKVAFIKLFGIGAALAVVADATLWAAVHGVTALYISQPGFPWPPLEEFTGRVLRQAVAGLVDDAGRAHLAGLQPA
jgi:putative drug exporter of the RND superfamily